LRGMLELAHPVSRVFYHQTYGDAPDPDTPHEPAWIPPIQRTVATEGTGVQELASLITRHQAYLRQTGNWARRDQARLEIELENLSEAELVDRWRAGIAKTRYQAVLQALLERRISPHKAVENLLNGDTTL